MTHVCAMTENTCIMSHRFTPHGSNSDAARLGPDSHPSVARDPRALRYLMDGGTPPAGNIAHRIDPQNSATMAMEVFGMQLQNRMADSDLSNSPGTL